MLRICYYYDNIYGGIVEKFYRVNNLKKFKINGKKEEYRMGLRLRRMVYKDGVGKDNSNKKVRKKVSFVEVRV